MTQTHPITPPPELKKEWTRNRGYSCSSELWDYLAAPAPAQWGADQELEACCEWLEKGPYGFSIAASASDLTGLLRAARRPKLLTLKEQALRVLVENGTNLDGRMELDSAGIEIISRALEALPE
jgi:hypothetical protein